jgi:tetratricopeptide (TPR) repeat protein
VTRGICLFKENKSDDAILYFNKALSIDEENVEALVAKGAM